MSSRVKKEKALPHQESPDGHHAWKERQIEIRTRFRSSKILAEYSCCHTSAADQFSKLQSSLISAVPCFICSLRPVVRPRDITSLQSEPITFSSPRDDKFTTQTLALLLQPLFVIL
jgi:hypothetical protein